MCRQQQQTHARRQPSCRHLLSSFQHGALPLSLLALLPVLLLHAPVPARAQTAVFNAPFFGLTDDACRTSADCVGPRLLCRRIRDGNYSLACNPLDNESCSCVARTGLYLRCTSSANCPQGERCIAVRNGTSPRGGRCSSCSAYFMLGNGVGPVDPADVPGSGACPPPPPTPTPLGLVFDDCTVPPPSEAGTKRKVKKPCRMPSTCAKFDEGTLIACKHGDSKCACQSRETRYCHTSFDCPVGERCATRGFGPNNPTRCMSCGVVNGNPHVFGIVDLHAPGCDPAMIKAHYFPNSTSADADTFSSDAMVELPSPSPSLSPHPEHVHHCPPSNGLSFDHCCAEATSNSCAFPRRCASIYTQNHCRPGEVGCVCLSAAAVGCESSADCEHGERCVGSPGRSTCLSCARVAATAIFDLIDDGKGRCDDSPVLPVVTIPRYTPIGPTPAPSTAPQQGEETIATTTSGSASGEGEETDEPIPSSSAEFEDSQNKHDSSNLQPDEVTPTRGPSPSAVPARAHHYDPLHDDFDAAEAEGANNNSRGLPNGDRDDGAPTMEPSPEPTDLPEAMASPGAGGPTKLGEDDVSVCVGAHHLDGVPLVFRADRAARVLCDARGSCATPAHVVVFNGRPMTMRQYCDTGPAAHAAHEQARVGQCVASVMYVNSPRMGRRVRVASYTYGLEFTALAARWETRAERAVLSILLSLGL